MHDLILPAIPFFVLFLVLEMASYRVAANEQHQGYETKDTATSLTMGLGSVFIGAAWGFVVLLFYAGLFELTPLRMPQDEWWTYALLFLADDLAFYWYHRISHEVRVFWASHVVHHSSEHFNLSTALRQPWVPMTALPFWAPLALLGFAPWMIFGMQSVSLIYQFFLHTERVGTLPRPIEFLFNTPSHHRVHHGSDDLYLDRNYAGILIVWDRMFGTFQGEEHAVTYGLTTNLETHNPVKVAGHEWVDITRDVRRARTRRERLGYLFGGPGWRPGAEGRGLASETGESRRAPESGPGAGRATVPARAVEPGSRTGEPAVPAGR